MNHPNSIFQLSGVHCKLNEARPGTSSRTPRHTTHSEAFRIKEYRIMLEALITGIGFWGIPRDQK